MKVIAYAPGCDDATYAQLEVTEQEAAVLERLAAEITSNSTYGCMPTLTITREGTPLFEHYAEQYRYQNGDE